LQHVIQRVDAHRFRDMQVKSSRARVFFVFPFRVAVNATRIASGIPCVPEFSAALPSLSAEATTPGAGSEEQGQVPHAKGAVSCDSLIPRDSVGVKKGS
jgi:hypothetical protein